MLSFLIPTYNYDCTPLVKALFEQATDLKRKLQGQFDFEILVADDASSDRGYLECYTHLSDWEGCRFFPLEKNIGRAKIRNFLASQARFDHFIFIDCDAVVCTDDFVRKYWENRKQGDVVCGSLRNLGVCPVGGELRYFYEKAAENQRTVAFRSARPYTYFSTFNVMFSRSVFEHLQFDERCIEYGYEDALMGLMLEREACSVIHIDNPLVHSGIDQSAIYLDKVETSLRVLYRLGDPLQSASALVCLERRLKKFGILAIVRTFYRLFAYKIRSNLVSRNPSLLLLKLYKLGYYAEYEAAHRKG